MLGFDLTLVIFVYKVDLIWIYFSPVLKATNHKTNQDNISSNNNNNNILLGQMCLCLLNFP